MVHLRRAAWTHGNTYVPSEKQVSTLSLLWRERDESKNFKIHPAFKALSHDFGSEIGNLLCEQSMTVKADETLPYHAQWVKIRVVLMTTRDEVSIVVEHMSRRIVLSPRHRSFKLQLKGKPKNLLCLPGPHPLVWYRTNLLKSPQRRPKSWRVIVRTEWSSGMSGTLTLGQLSSIWQRSRIG